MSRGNILLIDDEEKLRHLLKRIISLEGFAVYEVGDTKPNKVDVRFVTSTNRDLETEVSGGKFREDLFYRLNLFTIELPSLQARKEDIPLVADHFLHLYAAKTNGKVSGMNKEFISRLMEHEWKGNIRELKNIIERAVILANNSKLSARNLPIDFQSLQHRDRTLSAFELASMEKLHIQRVLNHTKGNKMAAAKLLNIGLTTLYRKIEEYQLAL